MSKSAVNSKQLARVVDTLVFGQSHDSAISASDARAIQVARYVAECVETAADSMPSGKNIDYLITTVIGPHPPKQWIDRITDGKGGGWTSGPANARWDALTAKGLSPRDLLLVATQFQAAAERGSEAAAPCLLEMSADVFSRAIANLDKVVL